MRFCARRINMHMCLSGREHMYISIRLVCIWFKWYLVWICIYTYILRSCGIYVCLYDQAMMSWFSYWLMLCLDVPVYLYSPKLWNICMLVWSGNNVLISMFGCARILIFFEVVEYMYACMTSQWSHWFYTSRCLYACVPRSCGMLA
jgi:hypothetical protein